MVGWVNTKAVKEEREKNVKEQNECVFISRSRF